MSLPAFLTGMATGFVLSLVAVAAVELVVAFIIGGRDA